MDWLHSLNSVLFSVTPEADGITWVLGAIATVGATLTSAVVYLFKLYYIDTKAALSDCHENHKAAKTEFKLALDEERDDCDKKIEKLSAIIENKQAQLSDLHRKVYEIDKNQSPPANS
jgi:hypothetical protein